MPTACSRSACATARSPAGRRRRDRAHPRRAGRDLASLFSLELGDGNAALLVRRRRARPPRRAATTPSSRSTCPVGDRRRSRAQRRDRRGRPARRPALPDDLGRHHAARGRRPDRGRGRLGRRRHRRRRRRRPSPSGRSRATSPCGPPPCAPCEATTTSGDLKLAGRLAGPGPFAIETVSGDGAPRSGRRRADRDDHALRRPPLEHRRPGPRAAAATDRSRSGRAARSSTFRSMSGDLRVVRASPVPSPTRAERTVPAAPAAPPAPAAPARPTRRTPAARTSRSACPHRRRPERRHRGRLRGGPAAHPAVPRARRDRRGRGGPAVRGARRRRSRPIRTADRPVVGHDPDPDGRARPMPDDALDRVLRLVADGRLTAAEAAPILDALESRPAAERLRSDDAARGRRPTAGHARQDPARPGHRGRPGRHQPPHPAVARTGGHQPGAGPVRSRPRTGSARRSRPASRARSSRSTTPGTASGSRSNDRRGRRSPAPDRSAGPRACR